MAHSRRQFIKRGITFVGAGLAAPRILLGSRSGVSWADTRGVDSRILVIVELRGGNDGLNTVVPYTQSLYRSYRPTLALGPGQYLEISDDLALHGQMTALKSLYDQNRVAVVQGVGYPDPNRSHFRSTEIWQTAEPDKIGNSGWLGRYLDATLASADGILEGIAVGNELPQAMNTLEATPASVASLEQYVFNGDARHPEDENNKRSVFLDLNDDLKGEESTLAFLGDIGLAAYSSSSILRTAAEAYVPAVEYPTARDGFGASMKLVAQMLGAGLGTNIFYVSLGSFDTHADQAATQGTLLKSLSDGISAFYQDMVAHGLADDVLVLTFSEFGRRVDENSSGGTDHGAAAPLFVVGNSVRGGIYGDHPSLSDLGNGDLKYNVDFRSVYTTVLKDWLDTEPEPIIGGTFENLGFLTPPASKASSRPALRPTGVPLTAPFPTPDEMERRVQAYLSRQSRL